MNLSIRRNLVMVCVLIFAAALTACTAMQRQTPEDRAAEMEARELLARLTATNQDLQSFKGIGRIRLSADRASSFNERVAWAGLLPAKLSVAVLASGLPVLKFATDGKHLYFLDMRSAPHSFHKFRSSDPLLDRVMSIPIRSSEILLLLAGRLPIRKHTRVRLATTNAGRRVLILGQWYRVVQKIYLDAERDEPQTVECFDEEGELVFRAELENMQTVKRYRIPRKIHITGSDGAWLAISVDRLLPDADVKPDMFILTPPDRDASSAVQ